MSAGILLENRVQQKQDEHQEFCAEKLVGSLGVVVRQYHLQWSSHCTCLRSHFGRCSWNVSFVQSPTLVLVVSCRFYLARWQMMLSNGPTMCKSQKCCGLWDKHATQKISLSTWCSNACVFSMFCLMRTSSAMDRHKKKRVRFDSLTYADLGRRPQHPPAGLKEDENLSHFSQFLIGHVFFW